MALVQMADSRRRSYTLNIPTSDYGTRYYESIATALDLTLRVWEVRENNVYTKTVFQT